MLLLALASGGYTAYRLERLAAFDRASVCGQAVNTGCRGAQTVTVDDTEVTDTTADLIVENLDAIPGRTSIRFEESAPLIDDVRLGDPVSVEIWHGTPWRVRAADGTSEYTSAAVRGIAFAILATLSLVAYAAALLIGPLQRASHPPIARIAGQAFTTSAAGLYGLLAVATRAGTNPQTAWEIALFLVLVASVCAAAAAASAALLYRIRRD